MTLDKEALRQACLDCRLATEVTMGLFGNLEKVAVRYEEIVAEKQPAEDAEPETGGDNGLG